MSSKAVPDLPADDNSANVPAPAPQPTLTIRSANEVASELVRRVPSLASCQASLELVVALYVAYIDNPLGDLTVRDAVDELDSLYKTDLNGVRDAIAEITQVDTKSSTEFADEFRTRTGRNLSIKKLDIDTAVAAERDEQQKLDRLARELLVKVQTVVNRLGVRDLYTLKNGEKKPARTSLLVNIANKTAAKLLGSEKRAAEAEPAPDWLTEPILNPDENDNYKRLVKFINNVIALMDRYAQQPNMRQLVLDYLANAKIDIDQVESSLEQASEFAHDQLEQSNIILAKVGHDQQVFADRIDGHADLRQIYGSVGKFFLPVS